MLEGDENENKNELNEKNEDLVKIEEDAEDENKKKKSCKTRFFGPMKEGSLRGSIFSLTSCCLGLGAFALPIRATQFGCINYLLCLFIGGVILYWSLTVMIKSARKVNSFDYSKSVKIILGIGAGYLIDISLIIDLFGFLTSNLVIVHQLIGRTIYDFFGDKETYTKYEDYDRDFWGKAYIKFPIMYGTSLILFPLCLLKNITKMRFISLAGVCILCYTILVIVVESPFFWKHFKDEIYKEDDDSTHPNWIGFDRAFTGSNLYFFTGLAGVFFAYTCQQGAFPIYKTLKNNNHRRTQKVFLRGALMIFVIYFLITFCGFITCPTKPIDLIIYRESIFDNDIFMTIAKIATAIGIFLSFAPNYVQLRCSIIEVIFKTDEITKKKNIITTSLFLIISTTLAAIYENILGYISLLGGFLSTIICFIIPGCMYLKTSTEPYTSVKNVLTIILIVVLSSIGFTSGAQTILEAIKGN